VNLFYQPLLPQGILHLDEEESRHCVKVLRKRKGDEIQITDGKGFFYDAVIEDDKVSACRFSVRATREEARRDYFIHIAIAPTKNPDRLEWFVEKATEFGIDKITFVKTDHSEKIYLKKDRLYKVAVSAMKQSLKATLPLLSDLTDFDVCVRAAGEQHRFLAYVDQENPLHLQRAAQPSSSSIVLIGPEGDFSKNELDVALSSGFTKVSLGKNRLRTETAGIAACHILNLLNA
jgi:16S rRNA (uracil1498-N3)-methyltransferase